jgi:hypothetical protein
MKNNVESIKHYRTYVLAALVFAITISISAFGLQDRMACKNCGSIELCEDGSPTNDTGCSECILHPELPPPNNCSAYGMCGNCDLSDQPGEG